MHTRTVQIWDTRGHKGKGKGLWCLIGAGDAYSRGPIWDAMGNWGDNVLCWQGVQWRKLNIPPMWVQQGIHLIWGMYAELLLQIWENLFEVLQSSIPPIWV